MRSIHEIKADQQPENDGIEWLCSMCDFPNEALSRTCKFCSVHRAFNIESQTEDALENAQTFKEIALWGVLGTLELLTDLTGSGEMISFQSQLMDPNHISLIIRLTIESSPQN